MIEYIKCFSMSSVFICWKVMNPNAPKGRAARMHNQLTISVLKNLLVTKYVISAAPQAMPEKTNCLGFRPKKMASV